jgi:molybdopterin-guanine dinucleotide biosynthesis protein A
MAIDRQLITGLVLSGGRGTRMGGVDKGLQHHLGLPLALHALLRLQPQVGPVMISANRNLKAYQSLGVPVWPDTLPDQPGPLAGLLTGLEHCTTPYLVTVPCDTPRFPGDLVLRLASALTEQDAELAMAATLDHGVLQPQPVFCLLHTALRGSLASYLQCGQRRVDRWTASHRQALVLFDDSAAFFNANTLAELQKLDQPTPPQGERPGAA